MHQAFSMFTSLVNELAHEPIHEPVYEPTSRVCGCSGSAHLTYEPQNDVRARLV